MQLSTRYGFAFLCMPKCASTSIEAAIHKYCNINFSGHPGIKHVNARDFHACILNFHKKVAPGRIETFCLMRHPVDWLFSWYRFRQREVLKNESHPKHKNYTGKLSFDEFVDAYLASGSKPSYANVGCQSHFMALEDGRLGVDRIFSMERLDRVAEYLSNKIGEEIRIPCLNVSPRKTYSLDAALEKELIACLSDDFRIYAGLRETGELNNRHDAQAPKAACN